MPLPYTLHAATLPGRDHVRRAQNAQDAFAVFQSETALAGIVCDGCGSGAHSEVGAKLGAQYLAAQAGRMLSAGQPPGAIAAALYGRLLAYLRALAAAQDFAAPENQARFTSDYLLFTVLGVLLTAQGGAIFTAGDGLARVDDAVHALDENNAPRYPAYHLLASDPFPAAFAVIPFGPEAARIGIATDGFDAALLAGLGGLHHPRKLQRLLNIWGERERRFRDDATVIFIERRAGIVE